ncbi:hypothetical protein BDK51DRAFT_43758 [Blyttiomyces helicus]|uniref:Uncharacterized protein n=1 Tax=Blyttiomyces helicus TaxID=388810 RepID=A0A4P9VY47_9FUNG|nr:hypothetical protein BDK51DRAFT_43758 [Blyttiomyces helicus]|eukprot:RKO84679.1 hypothetical protein BDK51DRAFT_43758 [Blyttiomyces helicus]
MQRVAYSLFFPFSSSEPQTPPPPAQLPQQQTTPRIALAAIHSWTRPDEDGEEQDELNDDDDDADADTADDAAQTLKKRRRPRVRSFLKDIVRDSENVTPPPPAVSPGRLYRPRAETPPSKCFPAPSLNPLLFLLSFLISRPISLRIPLHDPPVAYFPADIPATQPENAGSLTLRIQGRCTTPKITETLQDLYSPDAASQYAALLHAYHPDAVFQNPLVLASGVDNMIQIARVLPACCDDVRVEIIEVVEGSDRRGSHSHTIFVEVKTTLHFKHFLIWRPTQWIFGDTFTYRATHKLTTNDSRRVIQHEEMVSLRDALARLPVLGYVYDASRPVLATLVLSTLGKWVLVWFEGSGSSKRSARRGHGRKSATPREAPVAAESTAVPAPTPAPPSPHPSPSTRRRPSTASLPPRPTPPVSTLTDRSPPRSTTSSSSLSSQKSPPPPVVVVERKRGWLW